MVESDIAKVAAEGAAAKVRTNLAEYLEKALLNNFLKKIENKD